MGIAMQVRGVASVVAKMQKASHQRLLAVAAAIEAEGHRIMAESKKLCPVDTGRLRGSGNVSPATSIYEPVVTLSYGTSYAWRVHEDLQARHTVGEAKYLETPVLAGAAGYDRRIAEDVRRRLGISG